MAEVGEKSLDDFFAKRDKKKKKDKGKAKDGRAGDSRAGDCGDSGTPGAAAAAVKKPKKDKEKPPRDPDAPPEKEDEEWKEMEEQKEVDYSGLRLQSLQFSEEREDEESDKEMVGEDGEIILNSGSDKTTGPWSKTGAPPPAAPVEEEEEPEKPTGGVYRPPGARMGPSRRGPAHGPPEIYSDSQFPSLLSTSKHVETRRDREMEKTFEVVKHRTRGREDGLATQQQLQLDNQYAILGDK